MGQRRRPVAVTRLGIIWLLCSVIACSGDDDDAAGAGAGGTRAADGDGATGDNADAGAGDKADGGRGPDAHRDGGATADAGPAPDAASESGAATDGSAATDGGAPQDATADTDAASGADAGPACFDNVLLILDESASMSEAWDTSSRLEGMRAAVVGAVTAHAGALRVGALFFPNLACIAGLPTPDGGAVLPLSDAMQIDFRSGSDFLEAWNARLASAQALGIGTPLQEAFDRADVGLGSAALSGTTRVVLITDGDGNCIASEPTQTPDARTTAWKAAGIDTRVVSLASADAPQLADIATAAGTPLAQPTTAAELAARVLELLDPACSP